MKVRGFFRADSDKRIAHDWRRAPFYDRIQKYNLPVLPIGACIPPDIRKSELIIAFFVFEDGIVFGDQMDRAGLFAEPVVRFERNQKELALCETTTSAQMTLLISNPSAIFSFSLQQKNREKLHIRIGCGMKTNPKQHNNLSKRLQNAFKQYMICSLKEYLNGCIYQIARTANVFNELLDQQ